MGKVDVRRLSAEQRQSHLHGLVRTLERCGLSTGGQEFLCDLFKESEITMFARRIAIARFLLRGCSFQKIRCTLHVGLDNIHAIDRWLNAKLPEYRSVLCPRVRELPPSWAWIRRKYSSHAMLISVLLGDDAWKERPP